MFAQLTYLGRYTLELVLADAAAPLVWAILAVTLFRLGWGVYSMLALMRTRRMLRAGAMPRHGPGWRRAALAHRAACALLGAVYAVCLAVSLLELARYEKTPLPETGAGLPLLTLAEVEGAGYRRAAEAAPNVRDDVNQLVQTWTPGAPLGLSAWEAGYADGTQDAVYLVQRYCRLSGAGGAKAFGRGLARTRWLLEPEEDTVLQETPDTLVLANYEDGPGFHQTLLLVVDGPDVLFLHYWGGGARSADVGAAAQARFAVYTAAARGRGTAAAHYVMGGPQGTERNVFSIGTAATEIYVMHGETAAAAMYSRRLVKDKKEGKDLQPTIDKMNKLIQEYSDKSRPAACAKTGLVDEIVELPKLRNYLCAFVGASYQNPESICPFHHMMTPRIIRDWNNLMNK